MNGRCRRIQDILAESGATAFQGDASAQQHLADCADCYAVLTALSELDAALPALPIHDASDECVDALLNRVRDLPQPKSEATAGVAGFGQRLRAAAERASNWHTRLAASAAAVAVVSAACVAAVILMVDLDTGNYEMVQRSAPDPALTTVRKEVGRYQSSTERELETKKRQVPQKRERFAYEAAPTMEPEQLKTLGYIDGASISAPVIDADEKIQADMPKLPAEEMAIALEIAKDDSEEIVSAGEKPSSLVDAPTTSTTFGAGELEPPRIDEIADNAEYAPSLEIDTAFQASDDETAASGKPAKAKEGILKRQIKGERAPQRDERFAKFAFQEASGYWSNAYVPGDLAIRLLESRLNPTDREMLQTYAKAPLQLHDRAHPVKQPFDAPTEAAMEVYLQSDRTALHGAERLTLQVGLQGARRQGGTRPPMNIGVVLDLRGAVSAENATQMRAIVDALRTAREVGDRFSLRFAGRDCAVVDSGRFEYGPLSVALESCFGADPSATRGVALAGALESATRAVRAGDDPDAPLGSSMVLLVTSQSIASELAALEAIGHESAVAGVPISVAGVGAGVALDEIDRLTLAGQGNRRLVTTADAARGAVDRELSALSRAVARALRLRIRLAPGVKLIRVLDASRLDDEGAERVREAEQSIDLRMASELGIEADRGEDEDGIQIVIPSFYAGGSHAILLDVVAPEAGPIADVTLRYKDLIYQRNGVARANLVLDAESRPAGPLERNVLKNVLTVRMASALTSAGRALSEGHIDAAVNALREQRERLHALRASEPAFQSDTELATDLELLDEYLSLLGGDAMGLGGLRQYLANSLQLAGHFKTLPRMRAD